MTARLLVRRGFLGAVAVASLAPSDLFAAGAVVQDPWALLETTASAIHPRMGLAFKQAKKAGLKPCELYSMTLGLGPEDRADPTWPRVLFRHPSGGYAMADPTGVRNL